MKTITTVLLGMTALTASAMNYWFSTSDGGVLWSDASNWRPALESAPTADDMLILGSFPDGVVLTNDLVDAQVGRVSVAQENRNFTLVGNSLGVGYLDNSAGTTPVVHRYTLPLVATKFQTHFDAAQNTTQIFDGLISVAPTNSGVNACVRFGGVGTNIIRGGISAPVGCYEGGKYSWDDKTGFTAGTTILMSDCDVPDLYIGEGAHLIITNATLKTGWAAGNIGAVRTATIDLMNGGRLMPQSASLMLAQGSDVYTTTINVYNGGLLDTGVSTMRSADDGRFNLNVFDG